MASLGIPAHQPWNFLARHLTVGDGRHRAELTPAPRFPDAACRGSDPRLFFSDAPHRQEAAKQICGDCPNVRACLAYALRHEEFGVWGGTTPKERAAIRRTQGIRLRG